MDAMLSHPMAVQHQKRRPSMVNAPSASSVPMSASSGP
jgi:hypothetical protein